MVRILIYLSVSVRTSRQAACTTLVLMQESSQLLCDADPADQITSHLRVTQGDKMLRPSPLHPRKQEADLFEIGMLVPIAISIVRRVERLHHPWLLIMR